MAPNDFPHGPPTRHMQTAVRQVERCILHADMRTLDLDEAMRLCLKVSKLPSGICVRAVWGVGAIAAALTRPYPNPNPVPNLPLTYP